MFSHSLHRRQRELCTDRETSTDPCAGRPPSSCCWSPQFCCTATPPSRAAAFSRSRTVDPPLTSSTSRTCTTSSFASSARYQNLCIYSSRHFGVHTNTVNCRFKSSRRTCNTSAHDHARIRSEALGEGSTAYQLNRKLVVRSPACSILILRTYMHVGGENEKTF